MAHEVSLGTSGMVKINGLHGLLGGVPASESYDNFSTFCPSAGKLVEKSHTRFGFTLVVGLMWYLCSGLRSCVVFMTGWCL